MAISKRPRQFFHAKCGGHCVYCGKVIEIKDMQVDHIMNQKKQINNITYVP